MKEGHRACNMESTKHQGLGTRHQRNDEGTRRHGDAGIELRILDLALQQMTAKRNEQIKPYALCPEPCASLAER